MIHLTPQEEGIIHFNMFLYICGELLSSSYVKMFGYWIMVLFLIIRQTVPIASLCVSVIFCGISSNCPWKIEITEISTEMKAAACSDMVPNSYNVERTLGVEWLSLIVAVFWKSNIFSCSDINVAIENLRSNFQEKCIFHLA